MARPKNIPVPPARPQQPEERAGAAERAYRVVTDRKPFWNGNPAEHGEVITARPEDPAIAAMLERKWIVEA